MTQVSVVPPQPWSFPHGFVCHQTCAEGLNKIFAGNGLYHMDLPVQPKTILDIGANAGAFTVWALSEYPEAHITSYEPCAGSIRYFQQNVKPETRADRVTFVPKAVTVKPGPYTFLYHGAHNTGENTLYPNADHVAQGESVAVIHPSELPAADLIKLDCEGSELEILQNYKHLDTVNALAMEWHRPADIPEIIDILARAGLPFTSQDRYERLLRFIRPTVTL